MVPSKKQKLSSDDNQQAGPSGERDTIVGRQVGDNPFNGCGLLSADLYRINPTSATSSSFIDYLVEHARYDVCMGRMRETDGGFSLVLSSIITAQICIRKTHCSTIQHIFGSRRLCRRAIYQLGLFACHRLL